MTEKINKKFNVTFFNYDPNTEEAEIEGTVTINNKKIILKGYLN